jgi:GNAT superfamily N-acetyltransferase
MAPNAVAAMTIVIRARSRAFFASVTAMQIHYRGAKREDAPTIVEFQETMARETEEVELDREVVTRGVKAVFDDPSRGRYFVADAGGHVVASLLITYEWSDWRNGVVWWIQSVYVEPEFRGRGVYAGLYAYVKESADASVRGIRLYVDRRNTRAQEVYRRLGMDGEHYLVFEWMKG